MKVVLLAIGGAPELSPLTELTAAALLPIADKPLLVHAVESLAMARLTDAIVIVDAFGDEVKKTLGHGAKWGMKFEYLTIGGNESRSEVLRRVAAELNQDFLLMDSLILRTPMIGEFLTRASAVNHGAVTATIRGRSAGVSILRQGLSSVTGSVGNLVPLSNKTVCIDFPEARLALIGSAAALHRANLDVAAGHFPGLVLSGRELMPGVRVGRKSLVPTRAIEGAPVFVGARCWIAAKSELMSETVVSSDSVIDSHAILRRAVIMPHTYVGALVEISDAIVSGNLVIHIDTGTQARVTDQFLLSTTRRKPIGALVRGVAGRLREMLRPARIPPKQPFTLATEGSENATPAEAKLSGNHHAAVGRNVVVDGEPWADRAAGA
jgi:mannose-1-phosphate guanylyltransferase / phosphomannomutase